MRLIAVILVGLFLLGGCRSHPNKKIHTKKHTIIKRTIKELPKETVIYRPDTIYKDTLITVKGKVTKLRVNYNKKGRVNLASCEAPGGKITKENINEKQNIVESSTYVSKKDLLLYGAVFGFFMAFLLILVLLKK